MFHALTRVSLVHIVIAAFTAGGEYSSLQPDTTLLAAVSLGASSAVAAAAAAHNDEDDDEEGATDAAKHTVAERVVVPEALLVTQEAHQHAMVANGNLGNDSGVLGTAIGMCIISMKHLC